MEVKLTAILSAKVDAFLNGINQAASKLQKFGQDADKVGAGLSVAISAPLALLGRASIKTAGEFDSLERGLASLEKNATTLEARLKTLTAVANLPGGLGFKEAVQGDVNLRTVLNSIYGTEKAASFSIRTLKGFSNAASLVGKGSVEIGRALYGVQQLANTEFPLGEDLNIIKDALPQVSAILNEAFGTTRTEQLQKMKVSSQQVFEAILQGLEKLPAGTVGIATTFEQIQQAIDQRLAKIGKALFKTFDIGNIADKLLGIVDSLISKFDALSPIAQKVVVGIGAIAVIIPPIIAAIGLIAPAVTAGIGVIGALVSPIGAIAVAVGVAVGAIIAHWDTVKKSLVDSGAWETLSRVASAALSGVVSVFGVFVNLVQGDWGNLWVHLKNVVYSAASGIVQVVGDMMIEVISLIQKVSLIKMPALELTKSGIRGIQDAANAAVIPVKSGAASNLFSGLNFFNGSDSPTRKAGVDPDAEKKLKEYVAAQLEASKSIIDSLQRTRDISISLIQDETERKKAELKAQAADRRVQAEIEVQNEAVKAREIKAINEKLAADLKALSEIKPITSTAKGISTYDAYSNAGLFKSGDKSKLQKDLLGDSDKLPGLDNFLSNFDKFNNKFREKATQSADLAKSLGSSLNGAIQDMAVGVAESFAQMATGTGGLQAFAKNLMSLLGSVVTNLGKAAIAAGVAALSLKAVFATPAGAIAAGAAALLVGGIISAAASNTQGKFSGTKLARGGAVYGPTVALVGDNANAHVDPEIYGASSIMRKIVREETQGRGGMSVGVLRGSDIYLAGMEEMKIQNSFLR